MFFGLQSGVQGLLGDVRHLFEMAQMLDNLLQVTVHDVEHLFDTLQIFGGGQGIEVVLGGVGGAVDEPIDQGQDGSAARHGDADDGLGDELGGSAAAGDEGAQLLQETHGDDLGGADKANSAIIR